MRKNVRVVQTLIIYPKIYQISFVKFWNTKINWSLAKLLCVPKLCRIKLHLTG